MTLGLQHRIIEGMDRKYKEHMQSHPTSTNGRILTISIVTYNPNLEEFRATLSALADALSAFDASSVAITIVNNSGDDTISPIVDAELGAWRTALVTGQGNIGFGRGHNLAFTEAGEFHLILNPDIVVDSLSLRNAISFMRAHPDCGLLTPLAYWPDGTRQYLCKRYPSIFDLLLRGFAPRFIQEFFENRLSRYEMRAETQGDVFWNPPIVSGCFMFFRSRVLETIDGFDPEYFLYFEDFDLSLRTGRITRIAYTPQVQVIHMGGHAAKKGAWHIWIFARSSLKFFRDYGFRLA